MITCDLICIDVSDQPAASTFIVNLDGCEDLSNSTYYVSNNRSFVPLHISILGYAISSQGMSDFRLLPRSRLELSSYGLLRSE